MAKIVSHLKLLIGQNLWWYTNLYYLNVFLWHERGHVVTEITTLRNE